MSTERKETDFPDYLEKYKTVIRELWNTFEETV
jgi:hypothetical protein